MEGMIGEMRMFAGNFAPRSWALCEGQLLPIAQNSALFSILGTIYGGDGRTTFALPDLRGRVPIQQGRGPGLPDYREGQRGGASTTTLNVTHMPSHNHVVSGEVNINVADQNGDSFAANGNPLGARARDVDTAATIENYVKTDAATGAPSYNNGNKLGGVTANLQALNNGGNQAFNNMQPYLAINYIICLQGIFPSRS